jgi:hypothetical protein
MRSTMFIAMGLLLSACTVDVTSPRTVERTGNGSVFDPNANVSAGGAATVSGAERIEEIATDQGTIPVRHSAPLAPAIAGCADGTREAFHDTTVFPTIAGCMASWSGSKSMRAPATGTACGDQIPCNAPADACAPGWHVCGVDGALSDIRHVGAEQCANAGRGRYSAAISHCLTQEGCATDPRPEARYQCFAQGWCSEPVCCGSDCGEFGACTDGVWPGQTHIPQGMDQGCGAMSAQRAGGVLCCRNR